MTWQLQSLLPAGHNKSHAVGVSLGFPTGLTIIRTLYFTQFFFVGGSTQTPNVNNVITRFTYFMIKIMYNNVSAMASVERDSFSHLAAFLKVI